MPIHSVRFRSVSETAARYALVMPVVAAVIGILLCAAPQSAFSQSERAPAAGPQVTPEEAASQYFGDIELTDQDGKRERLFSDLMKGKVVIINPFFTTCTGVCPPMTKNLEAIQDWLGDRLGKDVHIISITVDPESDTPTKLKEYAARFHSRPGWYFVGGTRENTNAALQKLGQNVQEKSDHSTILIIGNVRTGLWKKALSMARPSDLIQIVESVLKDEAAKE